MIEGKKVNLRIIEKEDLTLVKEWVNNIEFAGEYEPISQETKPNTTSILTEHSAFSWTEK